MEKQPWFTYILSVHDGVGVELESLNIPGIGNDFPIDEIKKLSEKFGGIGYEIRIKTTLL